MLSKRSETFIENLRLYLTTTGKNLQEINELTEELRIHLIQSEKRGKSIDEIIDGSPEQYMDSLKREMATDYMQIIRLIPILLIGLTAFSLMGPAVQGEFTLDIFQVIGFPIVTAICLIIYIVFLQQAGRKQFSNKKLFIFGMITSGSTVLLYILLMFVSKFFATPFYVASDFGNWLVVGLCILAFIGIAVWSKSWLSIWLPTILFIPELIMRFTDVSITMIVVLQISTYILIFLLLLLSVFLTDRRRKREQS